MSLKTILEAMRSKMKQKAPPGMEPVVKALKKKKNIDNPFAVAWSMYGESNAANTLKSVLRSTVKALKTTTMKMKCSERGMARVVNIREANAEQSSKEGVREGNIVDVVLITEGLGNRRNMNYYGPEAIDSAPAVFEGKPCFLDHPSESEERDIPERRVRQKCGYFKNCRVETIENAKACIGELHFDLSEDGEQAYLKACTALHYKGDFPGSSSEWIGLSINADGDVEDRTVQWEGETLQVNYVTQFRDAMSCDIVTSPARGGRFLALVESAAGAKPKQEVRPMNKGLKKALEAAQTALEGVDKEKDASKKADKALEATKLFSAFLKEAAKQAYQDESEDEGESENEGESEDENEGEGESDGDSHVVTTHKVVKKTGKAAVPQKDEADDAGDDDHGDDGDDNDDDKDAMEAKRELISKIAKESGIELPKGKLERLAKGSLKEAKAEIADLKTITESVAKKVLKSIEVPTLSMAKVTESDRNGNADGEDSFLDSCIR